MCDVCGGDDLLFDDGELDMKVIDNQGPMLVAEVQNEGVLGAHKSVNVPGEHIDLPALTEKDRKNILLAIELDIDFIAHSFVRNATDACLQVHFSMIGTGRLLHCSRRTQHHSLFLRSPIWLCPQAAFIFFGLLCGLVYLLVSCSGESDLNGCGDLSIGMQIPMTRSADPEVLWQFCCLMGILVREVLVQFSCRIFSIFH